MKALVLPAKNISSADTARKRASVTFTRSMLERVAGRRSLMRSSDAARCAFVDSTAVEAVGKGVRA